MLFRAGRVLQEWAVSHQPRLVSQNSCRMKRVSVCNIPLSVMGSDHPQYISQCMLAHRTRVRHT